MEAALDQHGVKAVKHVILVLSGKGGVGKSTVAVRLAEGLVEAGYRVGLLDVDLCGPSVPRMLQIEDKSVLQGEHGWLPVYVNDDNRQLAVMSLAFFLNTRNDAVIWRGPKKDKMIEDFMQNVFWADRDFLIIDTPPGTSDEHISVIQNLRSYNPDGAVVVTTPQAVSVGDVRRELTFCKKTALPVVGIVENMSGFVCPHCSECTNIFSKGGGEALALHFSVPFLGCIPLCPLLAQSLDGTTDSASASSVSSARDAITDIVHKVISHCGENRT